MKRVVLAAAVAIFSSNAAQAEGLDLGNVLGAIVNGAAKVIDENQRRQNNQNRSPAAAPAPAGQVNSAGSLATGTECGNINGWAASNYHPSRTEQLFGKPLHQWSDADYSQANGRVSACRGIVDGNWSGRTDKTLQYLSEAKRSWDAYRAQSKKMSDEVKRLAQITPPEDSEAFMSSLDQINQQPPYGGVIVSSYDLKPKLPNRRELAWKIDTRPYDQALKSLNDRFVAKMPDHIPFMMDKLRTAFSNEFKKTPKMSAKVTGLKGQDLTWSIPREIFVTKALADFCAQGYAKVGFRGEQKTAFKQGCEDYVNTPSQQVVEAFKQDLSQIPASLDDMVRLARVCTAIAGGDALKSACSDQVTVLRQNLSHEDKKLARAWLGEPLSCEEAVQASDMDVEDLKETFFLTLAGPPQSNKGSFYDQVCGAARQGVQITFDGQGMFSGPDELLIQTNERILRGLKPVQITLASMDGPNGEALYYGTHIQAQVWDAMNKTVRNEDRPLKVNQVMQASFPAEWFKIKNCMNAGRKRGMGPNSCEKMAGILLYPSVR